MINKDMKISELLAFDPLIANILMREGMHCVTCASAENETLAEAGEVHGMSPEQIDELVGRLNEFFGD